MYLGPEPVYPNIPLFSEPEDSGIDSDDAGRVGSRPHRLDRRDISEGSSGDEFPVMIRPWWLLPKNRNEELLNEVSSGDEGPLNKRWWQAGKNNDEWKSMKDSQADQINIATWPRPDDQNIRKLSMAHSSDRSSPPLYEVELTASDEDDEASVLELVIPMQSSRYQRVPTSSPKKAKLKTSRFYCNLFCCVRK